MAVKKKTGISPSSAIKSNIASRKRFLKFRCFKAWRQQTFGSVSPAVARDHYQKKLLFECIRIWQTYQRQNRKEWKLQIRAEYHDRFRLWHIYFKVWRTFVLHERDKEIRVKVADNHAEVVLKRKCMLCLRDYVKMRQIEKKRSEKAIVFYKAMLFRKCWKIWLHQFNNECLLHNMHYTALHHWADTMLTKMFSQWKFAYMEKCDLNQKYKFSVAFYNGKLVSVALRHWTTYALMRSEKKRMQANADQIYKKNLVQNILNQWKRSYEMHMHVKLKEEQIIYLGGVSLKRRYLDRFVTLLNMKRNYNTKYEQAEKMYNGNVKKHCMEKLKFSLKLHRNKLENIDKADKFSQRTILRFYFAKWMVKCEHREEIEQYPLSKVAYKYFRTRQLSRAMFHWSIYVKEEKRKAVLKKLAESHHNRKIMPRCLTHWMRFTQLQKDMQEMDTVAMTFNRQLLNSKYFYIWLKHYRTEMMIHMMNKDAVAHHELYVLKRFYVAWRMRTKLEIYLFNLENSAKAHHQFTFLRMVLKKWRTSYVEAVASTAKMKNALVHHEHHLKRKCFIGLKLYSMSCRRVKVKEGQAAQHYNLVCLRKVMTAWKGYQRTALQIITSAEERFSEKASLLCSWILVSWAKFVKIQRNERRLLQSAESRYLYVIRMKVLRRLCLYANTRIEAKFKMDEAVIRARIKLEKVKLGSIFHKWKKDAVTVHHEKINSATAEKHYLHKLSTKIIRRWKCYVGVSFQLKYLERTEENRKTNTAIWWWSYQLQKKVFSAMHIYTEYKSKKKSRYRSALTYRRNMLLEKGVTKWIQYATHTMNMRHKIAYERQVQKSLEVQARVHRYALHWLKKTQMRWSCFVAGNNLQRDTSLETRKNTNNALCSVTRSYTTRSLSIPEVKKRPPPRLPAYLRESFDLSMLKKERTTLHRSTISVTNSYYTQQSNTPRCNVSAPTLHSPVIHPLERVSSDSMNLLELTDDENTISYGQKNVILLPPSTFMKCGEH